MKIKGLFTMAAVLVAVLGLASCGNGEKKTESVTPSVPVSTPTSTPADSKPADGVMTYAEYMAAELDSEVTIKGYIQAKQSWWDNKGTFYLTNEDGGYFIYELPCTEEQYNTDLAVGNYIKVTGIKGAWAGMIEVLGSEAGSEATYELLDGTKVFDAKACTSLNNDELMELLTQKVSFAELTVVSYEAPAKDGGDIYFDVTDGKNILTFCVESYLTGADTDVYKTALTLVPGDLISCEGFMYCYNTPQLHTTAMTKLGTNVFTKQSDSLSYAEYNAKANGEEVTIEGFVQAKQSWWDNKATVYLQDNEGAYFLYELPCTEEQFNTDLAIGNHIQVTGIKGAWAGMVEILGSESGAEATYKVLPGRYCAKAVNLTEKFADPNLASYIGQKVYFENLEVVADTKAPDKDGGDLYFDVKMGDTTLTFCVESYLTGADTDVYKAVLGLKAGDKITCEGFLYIYNTPQLHTIKVTVVTE